MLTKMVNGVEEIMSPDEEAEIRAEWDKNERDSNISKMKSKVEQLLKESDTTMIRLLEKGNGGTQAYKDYRQALRDIPNNFPDGQKIVWPETPF